MKTRTSAFALVSVGLIGGALLVRTHHDHASFASAQEHFVAADELQETGHLPQAIQEMKQAVTIDPRYYGARLGLAHLYDESGHSVEAVAVLEEGLRVGNTQDRALYHSSLADLFREQKDYARASQSIRQALADPPDPAANRKELMRENANLLENARLWDAAEQAWKDYLKSYPGDGSGLRGLRRVQQKRAGKAQTARSSVKTDAKN
ncbi:MAG TPA: tetratricopeptide repeat protein [Chthonomonadaceae bacterium]|nr:tetratricopeptide repeat protein [Chthonomonadaceae bacterium]